MLFLILASTDSDACEGKPDYAGGHTLANTAMDVRDSISPSSSGTIDAVSVTVDFGFTQTNWTLARNENCTEGKHRQHASATHCGLRCPLYALPHSSVVLLSSCGE